MFPLQFLVNLFIFPLILGRGLWFAAFVVVVVGYGGGGGGV